MALTRTIITANSVLATLTDEQIAAIETLSINDENSVIGAKTGALHGQYDQDVLLSSGIEKGKSEKSYDYVKRVISDFKSKADNFVNLQQQVNTLKTDKTNLEKQLRENSSDETIKQKLIDAEARLTQAQTLLTAEKESSATNAKKYTDDVKAVHVDYAFDLATTGLKFKSTIPESVKSVLIKNAKNEILAESKADLIDENGKNVLVFRDKDGNVLNNKENKLNPFTAQELITSKLKDVIDFGRKQNGAGTAGNNGGSDDNSIDLSNAKTQVDASNIIGKHLMSIGLTRQSPEFAEKQTALWKENSVDKLPIR